MNVFIVFDKENDIISIHKNREYAMQVAEDYIRSFNFNEEECAECLEMLANDGSVEDIVWIETYEVND